MFSKYSWRSKCKLLNQDNSQRMLSRDSTKSWLLKDQMDSIRELLHFGADKSHIPLSSSLLSKRSYNNSILTFSQMRNQHTERELKWVSHSCLVILQVFSVLSSHIQLILWFQFWTRDQDLLSQQVPKSRKSTEKLDSMDSGKVLEQEFSWLVPLPASNGLSTIVSRSIAVLLPLVVSEHTSCYHSSFCFQKHLETTIKSI